jgi:hypothetical protein
MAKAKSSRRPAYVVLACFGLLGLIAVGAMIGSDYKVASKSSSQTSSQGLAGSCNPRTTEAQRAAAQSLIQQSGHDCTTLDAMCPETFSDGYTVYCNGFQSQFELEDHGGQLSLRPE